MLKMNKVIIYCLSFLLVACTGNRIKRNQTIPETNSVTVVETVDSVFLKGVIYLVDSTTLSFPKTICYSTSEEEEQGSVQSAWHIPSGLDWVRIHIGKDINGYDVDVKLFPDKESPNVGYARYRFSSPAGTLEVDTGFYWDWLRHLECDIDEISYGRTYSVKNPFENLVQEDSPEIESCLFCFKDVDFDGEKELCFRGPGYNREYYNCYKIVGGVIRQMTGKPYNNIVYGYGGNTTFDYESHSINVYEEMGVLTTCTGKYVRKENVADLLDPMRQEEWLERTYRPDETYITVRVVRGVIVGESYEYHGQDYGHPIKADYLRDSEGVYHLMTVSYLQGDDEVIMYERN